MKCPYCGYEDSIREGGKRTRKRKQIWVKDSRDTDDGAVKRARLCPMCHNRFFTYERPDLSQITVIKKSGGTTEPFDREKIIAGIIKACEKRPVTRERIEDIASRMEKKIRAKGIKEIRSSEIGDMLMKELARTDPVAYIRFASVYKNFDSPEEFRRAVQLLKKSKG